MKWLNREINRCLLPAADDGGSGIVGYALWITSYAVRWLLVPIFIHFKDTVDVEWQGIDLFLTLVLTIAAATWFARMVRNPKDRPEFVWVMWFITRLFWELSHSVIH